jgi:hypothetical protein
MTATLTSASATRTIKAMWLPRLVPGILRLHRTALLSVAVIYLAFTAIALTVVHQVGHPRASILADQVFSGTVYSIATYAVYLPVIVAVFIGVPIIARSLETGTFRFAWTQCVGRRRLVATTLMVFVLELTILSIPLGIVLSRLWFDLSPQFAWNVWIDRVFFTDTWMMAYSSVIGLLVGVLMGLVVRRILAALAATTVVMAAMYTGLTWTTFFQESLLWFAKRMPITFAGPSTTGGNFAAAYNFSFVNFFYTDKSGRVISQHQFYSDIYPKLSKVQLNALGNHPVVELHRLGLTEWQGALSHPQFHELLMTWIGFGSITTIGLVVAIFAMIGGNDWLLLTRRRP